MVVGGGHHLLLCMRLWVAGISTGEYQSGSRAAEDGEGRRGWGGGSWKFILLDEFVNQSHDATWLILRWLLLPHEIAWNPLLHLWPSIAGKDVKFSGQNVPKNHGSFAHSTLQFLAFGCHCILDLIRLWTQQFAPRISPKNLKCELNVWGTGCCLNVMNSLVPVSSTRVNSLQNFSWQQF